MKRIALMVAVLVFVSSIAAFAQRNKPTNEPKTEVKTETTTQTQQQVKNPMPSKTTTQKFNFKGYVVSLNEIITGQDGRITNEEAAKLVANGQPLAFMSGKKLYFVFMSDGTFAGNMLSKHASSKEIGINGKKKTSKGITYIQANDIQTIN